MAKKFLVLVLVYFLGFNFSGCAAVSNSITEPKEPKLICNASYIQALAMVKMALKNEDLQFDKAAISKDIVRLTGRYADGRLIQILISNISSSASSLVVRAGTGQAARENAKKILATIMQYSKHNK